MQVRLAMHGRAKTHRIGDSPLAPHFQPLVRPNEWVKEASATRQVTDWGWDAYDQDLHVPQQRISVAKRIVEGVAAAIEETQKPWQAKFRKGYVAFQRAGGYNVIMVDLWWNKPVRLSIKLPASQTPDSLGLSNPFPQLTPVWVEYEREWGWRIPAAEDPRLAVRRESCRPVHRLRSNHAHRQ